MLIVALDTADKTPARGAVKIDVQSIDQKIAALDKTSFFIDAGEKVGIIGRIGSGKSTIARLVLGLYQPASGAVLMSGLKAGATRPDTINMGNP